MTLEFKIERIIPAPPNEVFDGWLNPKIPGNPWNVAEKFVLDPKVDGLFYWTLKGTSHYGRFTEIERPVRIRHTWMSPKTLGQESMVTLTFKKQGEDTLMTLVHSDLPDHDLARGHEKGWNHFLEIYREQFGNGSRKKYRWDDAHPPVMNYTATISVNAIPEAAFEKIAQVGGWWAKKFTGQALEENDAFTVRFGETFVDFKITEAIPGKKIVWYVTDCNLHWISDKKEWKGTKVVWEISSGNNATQIKMTHVGLVPGVECYNDCETGWNGHVKESLVAFINENKGRPE